MSVRTISLCIALFISHISCAVVAPRKIDENNILQNLAGAEGVWVESLRDGGSLAAYVHGKGKSLRFVLPIPDRYEDFKLPVQRLTVNWMNSRRKINNDYINNEKVISSLRRVLNDCPVGGEYYAFYLIDRALKGERIWHLNPRPQSGWSGMKVSGTEIDAFRRSKLIKQLPLTSRGDCVLLPDWDGMKWLPQ